MLNLNSALLVYYTLGKMPRMTITIGFVTGICTMLLYPEIRLKHNFHLSLQQANFNSLLNNIFSIFNSLASIIIIFLYKYKKNIYSQKIALIK